MKKAMTTQCFMCQSHVPFGNGNYQAKRILPWDIMVCDTCRQGNWDGIVPSSYPHFVKHLQDCGLSFELNKKGWIEWPSVTLVRGPSN